MSHRSKSVVRDLDDEDFTSSQVVIVVGGCVAYAAAVIYFMDTFPQYAAHPATLIAWGYNRFLQIFP
jgi:hypothetical protein